MTVKEIMIEYLKANGYDGLFNRGGECGCQIDDLAPCCESFEYCEPGYLHKCSECPSAKEAECQCEQDPGGWCIGRDKP